MSYSDPHIKAVRGGVNMPGMGGQHGPESLTTEQKEIERLLSYIQTESAALNNNPSIDQINNFISSEESQFGSGKLSDGSSLVSTVNVNGYQHGNRIDWYTDRKSFDNAWHSVQGTLTPDALDPRTVGHNLFWLTYPGPWNPKTYAGNDDYSYSPSLVEIPAYLHDKEYDALGIKGAGGLFTDAQALGADYRFVTSQLALMNNPLLNPVDRVESGILGVGLGLAATPKAINHFLPRGQGVDYNVNPARPFE